MPRRYRHPASYAETRYRTHKGLNFKPVYRGTKREINRILTEKKPIRVEDPIYHNKQVVMGRLADKRYFRIYPHKGQRYTLYLGPEKVSHGGLRHKPPKEGSTVTKRVKERKMAKIVQETEKVDLKEYDRIPYGPHEGKYFHRPSGNILTGTQIKTLMATKGKKR